MHFINKFIEVLFVLIADLFLLFDFILLRVFVHVLCLNLYKFRLSKNGYINQFQILFIMRVLTLFLQLLTFSLCFQFLSGSAPLQKSKQMNSYTIFTVQYPQSNLPATSQMFIRGDNCNLTWIKGISIKKTALNTWATALLCPRQIKISIKLLINDTLSMKGPNHSFIIKSSDLDVNIEVFPTFYPKINQIVDTQPIYSQTLNNQRRLSIYYPPSYFDNKYKTYQLLILHDGQNLFNNSKASFGVAWMCQDTVNGLIMEGKMQQIIVVGIWSTSDRINQYSYVYETNWETGGKGNLYLDFIQNQLLPKLQAQYFPSRIDYSKGLGIGGSSLGGLLSIYAVYTRSQIFKKGIGMSSSFWWNNEDFRFNVIKNKPYPSARTSIYIDTGDSGPSLDNKEATDNAKEALLVKGYTEDINLFYFLDQGGQHTQSYWGKRFWVPLTDLYSLD